MAEKESENKIPDPDEQFEALSKKIADSGMDMDMGRIEAAYAMARLAHSGQLRRDGSPYVTHCVAAADIAVDMGLDEDSIVAALLHDVIEDTQLTYQDIARQFGEPVANIVEGVTKLTRVQYTSKEDEQMENLRKMLMAMAKDIRVILIKIADRLHNMRTMAYQTEEKQRIKSLETMEIYAPIAHRLGMQKAKWELEDLALMYLDPTGYNEIMKTLESRMDTLKSFMQNMETKMKKRLEDEGLQVTVYSRIKHIFSTCAPFASSWTPSPTATMFWALSTICSSPCPVDSRTISPPRSPICIRAFTRRSSAPRAYPLRFRSAHGICTAPPNTASPRTGSTRSAIPE